MPKVYISGPMTGLPESNYPAFNRAAAEWRALGWEVDNPAEHFGGDASRTYKEYVEVDIESLKASDAIAMLPGWDSPTARGSVWEHAIAVKMLGLPVYDATVPIAPWGDGYDPRCGEVIVLYDEYLRLKRIEQQIKEPEKRWVCKGCGSTELYHRYTAKDHALLAVGVIPKGDVNVICNNMDCFDVMEFV